MHDLWMIWDFWRMVLDYFLMGMIVKYGFERRNYLRCLLDPSIALSFPSLYFSTAQFSRFSLASLPYQMGTCLPFLNDITCSLYFLNRSGEYDYFFLRKIYNP
jgi:hypothetical protein